MIQYAMSEMAVRDMLRTRTELVDFLNNDVSKIDIDYQGESDIFINMYRAGGFPSKSTYVDNTLMNFHCYGRSRKQAGELAVKLIEALVNTVGVLVGDTYFYECTVQSHYYNPDSVDGHPRFVVGATIRTRPGSDEEINP